MSEAGPQLRASGPSAGEPNDDHHADPSGDAGADRGAAHQARGRTADRPGEVPAAGWREVALRVKDAVRRDNATLLAAGVAFFALLALVPALAATIAIWGLFASPEDVESTVANLASAMPESVQETLREQLANLTTTPGGGLGLTAAAALALSLWSASSGVQHLLRAVNAAYDEDETRGFLHRRALALALTLGAVTFFLLAVGLIAVLPAALASTGLADAARIALNVLRWPVLALAMLLGVGVVYRVGADRSSPRWRWISPGALAATGLWLVGSALFAWYASNFGNFNETYGSIAGVIVLMLWLYLGALAILLGAELNSELERQTVRDTTTGPDAPMGLRGAYAADTVAGDPRAGADAQR